MSLTNKAFRVLTLVLLALLPLHAFLVTWLGYGLGIPGPLGVWKEFLLGVLFVLSIAVFALKPRRISFDKLDLAILLFLTIGGASAIITLAKGGSMTAIFYGFKYDFLMLVTFLLFRHGPLSGEDLREKAPRVVAIGGSIVILFALLHATVLPRDFLAHFGYTPSFGTWDPEGPIATYQALDENHPLVVRAMGTFAGPNQFAMYTLIVTGLVLAGVANGMKDKWRRAVGVALSVLAIVLSFSRSALVGLIASGIALPILAGWQTSKWKLQPRSLAIIGAGVLSALLLVWLLVPSSFLRGVLVRGNSTDGHWSRSVEGAYGILEKPLFGHGIGTAGPASVRSDPNGMGWIPENWYLQIGLEYGLIGLIVWLAILFLMARKLYEQTKLTAHRSLPIALLFSFIAINVACLFLHAWEDSAVAITWWGLAGLVLHKEPKSTT